MMNRGPNSCIVIGSGKMGLLHGALANRNSDLNVIGIIDSSVQSRLIAKGIGIKTPILPKIRPRGLNSEKGVALICTPPSSHFTIAKIFLENEWAVFVEKPLTMDPEKSKKLLELAESKSVYNQVGFQLRFSPVIKFLKIIIKEQKVNFKDDIDSIHLSILSPQFSQIKDEKLGENRGGIEWDLLPHIVDLCLHLTETDELGLVSVKDSVIIDWKAVEATIKVGEYVTCKLVADWATEKVRKVECSGKILFKSGKEVEFDPDRIISRIDDSVIFHRRKGRNPDFEIADQEYSFQMEHISSNLNQSLPNHAASFRSGWIVDSVISEILEGAS